MSIVKTKKKILWLSGGSSRWKVGYQLGIPGLVLVFVSATYKLDLLVLLLSVVEPFLVSIVKTFRGKTIAFILLSKINDRYFWYYCLGTVPNENFFIIISFVVMAWGTETLDTWLRIDLETGLSEKDNPIYLGLLLPKFHSKHMSICYGLQVSYII